MQGEALYPFFFVHVIFIHDFESDFFKSVCETTQLKKHFIVPLDVCKEGSSRHSIYFV